MTELRTDEIDLTFLPLGGEDRSMGPRSLPAQFENPSLTFLNQHPQMARTSDHP